jgi:hypothetical protein
MKVVRPVDVPRLFALWADHTLTRVDVAHGLGLSPTQLTRLVAQYRLPPRPRDRNQHAGDPTPDEIAERARQCRERHYAQRRAEPDDLTNSKVSQWRRGVCCPGGARHA